jgi:hypothetical protein
MRRIYAALPAIVAVVAWLFVTATPAQAYPTGCGDGPFSTTRFYQAKCTGGTGTFQAWVQCRDDFWPHNYEIKTGPWASPGQTSTAWCTLGYSRVWPNWGISRRN